MSKFILSCESTVDLPYKWVTDRNLPVLFYTYVVDGDKKFMLYAGGAGQYAWLENYVGQTLTIELAVCDWNAKGNKGCVLSVTTADGTKVINNLNFAH